MNYEQFEKYVREHSQYEVIYDDLEGRRILVLTMLDAFAMYTEMEKLTVSLDEHFPLFKAIEVQDE